MMIMKKYINRWFTSVSLKSFESISCVEATKGGVSLVPLTQSGSSLKGGASSLLRTSLSADLQQRLSFYTGEVELTFKDEIAGGGISPLKRTRLQLLKDFRGEIDTLSFQDLLLFREELLKENERILEKRALHIEDANQQLMLERYFSKAHRSVDALKATSLNSAWDQEVHKLVERF